MMLCISEQQRSAMLLPGSLLYSQIQQACKHHAAVALVGAVSAGAAAKHEQALPHRHARSFIHAALSAAKTKQRLMPWLPADVAVSPAPFLSRLDMPPLPLFTMPPLPAVSSERAARTTTSRATILRQQVLTRSFFTLAHYTVCDLGSDGEPSHHSRPKHFMLQGDTMSGNIHVVAYLGVFAATAQNPRAMTGNGCSPATLGRQF